MVSLKKKQKGLFVFFYKSFFLLIFALLSIFIIKTFSFTQDDSESWKYYKAEKLFRKGVYYFNRADYILSSNYFLDALFYYRDSYKFRYWLAKSYYYSGYVRESKEQWKYLMNFFTAWEDPFLRSRYYSYFSDDLLEFYDFDFLKSKKYIPGYPLFKEARVFDYKKNISKKIENPSSVYWDEYNHEYWVVGYTSNNIILLDRNGSYITDIQGTDYTKFKNPYDIIFNSKNEFFISDSGNHQVHKFQKIGNKISYVRSIGASNFKDPKFKFPKGLDIDHKDFIYLVDSGNNRIQKLNSNGKSVFSFGDKGDPKELLSSPTDVVVHDYLIYVTDTGNKRIQVYDMSGNWVQSFGDKELVEPRGLKLINKKYILVADFQKGLWVINLKKNKLSPFKVLDQINTPSDLFVDRNRYLYSLDFKDSEFKIFFPEKLKYTHFNIHILSSFYTKVFSGSFNTSNPFIDSFLSFFNLSSNRRDIVHKVLIKDQLGQPLYGLDDFNFIVYDKNQTLKMGDFNVIEKKDILSKTNDSIFVLYENTLEMKANKEFFEIFLKRFFKHIETEKLNIHFDVIKYNKNYQLMPFIDYSQNQNLYHDSLSNLLLKDEYSKNTLTNSIKSFDKALYQAIYRLVKKPYKRKAIFIFTAGNLEDDIFNDYSYENCLYYAQNNQIPIYIFSFNKNLERKIHNKNQNLFNLFAKKTNGLFINLYNQFKIKDLFDHYIHNVPSIYYIRYPALKMQNFQDRWQEVEIEVALKGITGKDQNGYFLDF